MTLRATRRRRSAGRALLAAAALCACELAVGDLRGTVLADAGAIGGRLRDCIPPCRAFPADAGVVDVTAFGAKGDSVTDDTGALMAAIGASRHRHDMASIWPPILYLPAGVYRVSGTLERRGADGNYTSGLILQGAGRDHTIIRLTNHSPGFQDPASPKAVVFTSSHLWEQGGPTGGGKDWVRLGEGNQAFANSVRDLTIDVGIGNPGAVAIDYLANNQGAIRNVRVIAGRGSGAVGVAMTRKWPGPALLSAVEVNGFDIGIDVGQTEYSVTLEDIVLRNQRLVGLRNNGNLMSVRKLSSSGPFRAIENLSPQGLLVLLDSHIETSRPPLEPVVNAGFINLINTAVHQPRGAPDTPLNQASNGTYLENRLISSVAPGMVLPAKDPPAMYEEHVNGWVSPIAFGARPDDGTDDSAALQEAIDSGARTIYLPYGRYDLSGPVAIRDQVQRIVGMNSEIVLARADPEDPPHPFPAFLRTDGLAAPVVLEDVRFHWPAQPDATAPDRSIVLHEAAVPVHLRDVLMSGQERDLLFRRGPSGGEAFLENVCCGRIDVAGVAGVWARQLNTEGAGVRVQNRGAPLWVLGLKTEGANTVVRTSAGGHSVILGGLLYPVRPVPEELAAFEIQDGRLLVSIAESAYQHDMRYVTLIEDQRSGRSLTRADAYERGLGLILPLLSRP